MGYMSHKAIVFTGIDFPSLEDCNVINLHHYAQTLFEDSDLVPVGIITAIYVGVNGYVSFALLPDGSKEWWEASDFVDSVIEKLIVQANEHEIDWGLMQFTDDANVIALRTQHKQISTQGVEK